MKSKFILIAILMGFLIVIVVAFSGSLPFSTQWSNTIEALTVVVALIISSVALFYATEEYHDRKNSEKTSLLCSYLQRYDSDTYITKITEYILETALLDENENIIGFDKNKKATHVPSIREKEMFMGFFEEIQLLIENKDFEKDTVIDLMGYYAGIFHNIPEYHEGISDYEDERYWKYYLRFVRSIPKEFFDIK